MRRLLAALLVLCLLIGMALGQNYTPRAGETVMKIAVEGRGNIFVRLFTKEAPNTTSHISRLAKQNFYDGQRFHRVVKSPKPYLIQAGDPASKAGNIDQVGAGGSGARVPYENTGKSNKQYAVGLAVDPNSKIGDSQFYILLADQTFLDGKYPVFGEVVAGQEVVQKIEKGDRIVSVSIVGG